jgi:hypothetical protein
MSQDKTLFGSHSTLRVLMLIAAVATVFVASYAVAGGSAQESPQVAAEYGYAAGAAPAGYSADASGESVGSCSCCGGSGETVEGQTTVDGDVQRVNVDIDLGYVPNVVYAKVGVPIEITFAQGDGCFAEVMFPEFDVFEDLTQGPVTITLPALEPGEYGWSCGMQMVYGAIIVE